MNSSDARTRTRKIHWAMLYRCQNTACSLYKNYGGRGIKVCDRWQSFESFLDDMGFSPKGFLLDRIDNDGHYEPGNCRWTDRMTSNTNKRGVVMLTHEGMTDSIAAWARRTGLSKQVISKRLQLGWSVGDALNIPTTRQIIELRAKLADAERENKLLRDLLLLQSGKA